MRTAFNRRLVVLFLAGCTALAGCGTGGPGHLGSPMVVASTDAWGSVARAVAGNHIPVRSILAGADIDPHSYQASPSEAAAIIDASLVVYNGGGYDPWVDDVLAGHRAVNSVNAFSFAQSGANEHVFYDPNVAKSVADTVAEKLAAIDPRHTADYRANAAEFRRGADAINDSEHAIAKAYPGAGVIATEPVAHYLLARSGLVDRTPPAFAAANENETDPAPADMAAVLNLIEHRQVAALVVNPQTSTAAITGLQDAARRAGVPVTEATETLPDGIDYLTWQRRTVSRLLAALRSNQPAGL
ncbi:ABC transporter substrate-binding protein [Mycobacterium conspicuum]|uniref:ABC transporter substrate-binding protein n=1 Tax=Mycobacterium conspicuum TaxID=44010 RepID=A0A1X1TRM6_9MYCO|nr:ABC transporter substrate-binding protein [Mycobacterium conspicuum]BBZ41844.1 ABC transporter substrate-binding protein [Mycobacterium conspicuum]